MFTGIIEETGIVKGLTGTVLEVECRAVLEDTKIGDSIAINGCCQTVTEISKNSFKVCFSQETLRVTTFGALRTGASVNLERALTPSTRMGGHIVSGHVDCTGVFKGKNSANEFSFEVPDEAAKYIVHKGSVAIDGISLTVASVENRVFTVAVIPHTIENTTLKNLKINDAVNIETDILGKYVEKLLCVRNNKISEEFLQENGFF
jgi:riboflavin synthase